MQRLKIALVVHDLHHHGGHSAYTAILANELSHRHDVTVFANYCERPADAPWQFKPVRAVRGSALSTIHTFPRGLRSHAQTLDGFDIRHMQGYCGGSPNVVTAHICVAAYLKSLESAGAQTRASLRLTAATERRFYRRYQGLVIAVSEKVADELRDFYGVRGPMRVIPHGVDPVRFNPGNREQSRGALRRQLGYDEDQAVVLYVGDLTKSQAYLKLLSTTAPDLQLVIVTASLKYHWQKSNVRILPPTTELEGYYAAADAFVFPTTYDAFGMVVLEAMASGLPVFSSDCAGAAGLIRSGHDGFVFPLEHWVEDTIDHLKNRELLKAVGGQAATTAQQHGWPSVVSQVEQIYRSILI